MLRPVGRAVGRRVVAYGKRGMMMRIGALVGLVGLGLVLVVPGGALAHSGVDTPQGHAAEDNVVLTPSAEAQLSRESAQNNAAARAQVATVTGDPGVVGQWGP